MFIKSTISNKNIKRHRGTQQKIALIVLKTVVKLINIQIEETKKPEDFSPGFRNARLSRAVSDAIVLSHRQTRARRSIFVGKSNINYSYLEYFKLKYRISPVYFVLRTDIVPFTKSADLKPFKSTVFKIKNEDNEKLQQI